jgi:hypothetical protein
VGILVQIHFHQGKAMKAFKTLLRQHASPGFVGWWLRMAEGDIRVDPSPVLFAALRGPIVTIHAKEVANV